MTHQTPEQLRARFLKQFNALAQHRRRYEVFRDFVTLSAISLNNVMEPDAERKAALEAEYMGIIRTTFVIDENGRIERVINDVNTSEHTQQILS